MELKLLRRRNNWNSPQWENTATALVAEDPLQIPPEARDAFHSYLPAISMMQEQLGETVNQIEGAVVGVCANFEDIAGRARESVAQTAKFLAKQDSAGESISVEDLIEQCQTTMETLLGALAKAGEVSRRAVEQIRNIDDYSNKISKALIQLDGIAEGNKILAINARIEAAHAGDMGVGFAVVANEVNVQAQKSHEVISHIGELASGLRQTANCAVADLEQMDRHDRASAAQAREKVDSALDGFQNVHSRMQNIISEMSSCGEMLADDIAGAIRGLQFQDRTSQRLGHVREGLGALHERIEQAAQGEIPPVLNMKTDLLEHYTMQEERRLVGVQDTALPGEIELF